MKDINEPKLQYNAVFITPTMRVTALYSLHYFAYVKHFSFLGERHGFYELIYCDSGEAEIRDNDNVFTLKQGELFLHAPNHYHAVKTGAVFTNVTVLGFDGTVPNLTCDRVYRTNAFEKTLLRRILEEGRNQLTGPLNLVVQTTLPLKEGAEPQRIAAPLELLLLSLSNPETAEEGTAKQTQAASGKSRNYHEALCKRMIALMHENLNENIRLSELAAHFGFSVAYIKRIFAAYTGKGIIAFFNELKIRRAKQMMSESEYSVSQIAQILGFSSLQYFSRQFKKAVNMSPSQYVVSIRLTKTL